MRVANYFGIILVSLIAFSGCSEKSDKNGTEAKAEVTTVAMSGNIPLKSGLEYSFKNGGNALYFLEQGWQATETTHTWSAGQKSTMLIPLDESLTGSDIRLTFRVLSFGGKQNVDVVVNGTPVSKLNFEKNEEIFSIEIPKNLTLTKVLHLEIHIPNAKSPKDVGINSSDERVLGIGLITMTADKK